jgi:DNA-binding IclR family transcriptional regulator
LQEARASDGNRSLERGLAVLDCVWEHRREGIRVVELMRYCALERATVYRLLSTLMAGGHVARRGRFHYIPGPRFAGVPAGPPVDDVAARLAPVLKRICLATEDAAFAVVREGGQSHCIAREIGTYPVQVLAVQVGRRQPLGVGAAGLALLASLPPREADAIVAANQPALAGYGGMTAERMELLLKATRERGWSVIGNHVVAETLGVGCAVPSAGVTPLAAVSVAAPLQRMSRQRQAFVVTTIRQAIAALLPKGL